MTGQGDVTQVKKDESMKKTVTRVFLLTLLILAVALFALAASPFMRAGTEEQAAQAEDLPVISTGNVEVLRGKYFTVDVILSNNTLGLTSLDLFLEYDPTVMTLVKYDTTKTDGYVLQGSALSSLGLTTSNFASSAGMNVHPVQLFWNGVDPDYTNGTIVTLRFKSISSSAEGLLGKHYFTLSYRAYNTFRTTPKSQGGNIIYQAVDLEPGYVDVTAGKFQCTYYDWDGREIVHYEENDFSLFVPEEPEHPSRASTRTHYFTYEADQWDAVNPWTPGMEEPESIHWDITALYSAHAQPYTVYYYFGEKDPETGVISMGETADDYYYTWKVEDETKVKDYCLPKDSLFGNPIYLPAAYTEAFYSLSPWYTDIDCTEVLYFGTIPEDTTVDEATVAASPRGVPLENTFKLKLYAYRQQNEDVIPPEGLETNASKVENVVTIDGSTVTVNINLTKNFGIMSMMLTLDFDRDYLTLTDVSRGAAFDTALFYTTNECTPIGYARTPFSLVWENASGNYYGTGTIATLTFTLDETAPVGEYLASVTYTEKQDVTRYYDETEIGEGEDPVPAMLWYTTLNVVDGYVIVREVNAPTAHEGNYYFNKTEQTYTFADDGDASEYNIVTSNKRTLHGEQTVTVSLKTDDNVYRFWKAAEGRPRGDRDFSFEILKRSVTIPTASSVTYTYNHAEQTYAFDNAGDTGYYTATDNFKRTLVGSQTITCSLDYPEECYWGENEEDVANKNYTFEIVRLRVAKPVSAGLTYTYDTTEQTYAFTTYGDTDHYTLAENSDKRTVHGTQYVVCALKDTANYCWDEENDPTAELEFPFTIQKRAIIAPLATAATYVYSGTEKTYLFAAEPQQNKELYYSVSGDKKTAAGEYVVTVTLLHKDDTYWAETGEDTTDIPYAFVVEKQPVVPPTASTQSLTFNIPSTEPKVQTYLFAAEEGDSSLYTVDDEARSKWQSGTTYIAVALKDKDNYKWSTTGSSADLAYDFVIAQKAVVKPTPNTAFTDSFVYTGSPLTFYMQNTTENKYYTVLNNTRTDAGTYTGDDAVKISLKYPAHCYWAGSEPASSETVSYDFVIAKKQITKPSKHSGIYTYNGEEQTYTFASFDETYYHIVPFDAEYYNAEVGGDKRTLAGEQLVIVALNDRSNYAWKPVSTEAVTSNDLKYTFAIVKQSVPKPGLKYVNGSLLTYTYSGEPIAAQYDRVLRLDLYTLTNGTRTDAGTYEGDDAITFTLNDTDNYQWSGDNSIAPVKLTFTIRKLVVAVPTGVAQTVEYNGAAQTYAFTYENADAIDKYFTRSAVTYTDAGEYTITCALISPSNTYWSTAIDDVANKTFSFTITKKNIALIIIADKKYQTGVEQTSGFVENADVEVLSDPAHIDAGTYDLVVRLRNGNYRWSDGNETLQRTFQYKIVPVINEWKTAPAISGWTYDGTAQNPGSAEAKEGNDTLVITYHASGSSEYTDVCPVDAGNYAARFYVPETVNYSQLLVEISFTIQKATLDMTALAWDYTTPFTYDGGKHTVSVTGLPTQFSQKPEVFYPIYQDNEKTDRGDYTAYVEFAYDTLNYNVNYGVDPFVPSCDYTIDPCVVPVVWTYASSYQFTGNTLTVPSAKYVNVAESDVPLTVTESAEKQFLASGNYHFTVTISDPNYVPQENTDYLDVTVDKKPIAAPVRHNDLTDPYIYTGSELTYSFDSGFDSAWMTASNNKRTVVGTHNVSVDLLDKINTYWADTEFSVETLTDYPFTVQKAEVVKPTATVLDYTYSGEEQTYVFGSENEAAKALYEVSGNKRTVSGSQSVTVSLVDGANYRWKKGDSENLAFTFSIAKLAVTAPTADETAYVYDGTVKTYTFKTAGDSNRYTPANTSRTNAGSQTVTVALINKTDTYWADTDQSTTDIGFTFAIAKAEVKRPTADTTAFVYSGEAKTYEFGNTDDSALYSLSGATVKTASGTTDLTVTLTDSDNYRWKDGDSLPLVFPFTVGKLAVTAPTADETEYVYDGTVKTYTFKTAGDTAWYVATNATRTDAGSQTVTVKLTNKADTYWADTDEDVTDLIFTLSIAKAEATPPTAGTATYVYTGAEQTYAFAAAGDSALYSVGSLTMTTAGSTEITVSLISPSNYRWKGTDSSAPINFTFVIAPAKIAKPAPDQTAFFCNGKTQTYTVAPSIYYEVSGASKATHGTTNVVIALADKNNYVWDNAPEADSNADLKYPFTINHDFKNKYVLDGNKASDADCTNKATYYFVCDCGEIGTETFEVGEPLGHLYDVDFEWEKYTAADGTETYPSAIAHVICTRAGCSYDERMPAEVTVKITPPGEANGEKIYTAKIVLDHPYTDTRTVVIPAVGVNFGEPVWTWGVDDTGKVTAEAEFTCIDPGAEHIKFTEQAEIEVKNVDAEKFSYYATAYFNGVEYHDTSLRAKPTLTFVYEDESDSISYRLAPGEDATSLIPAKPTLAGAEFLKWSTEKGLTLVYTATGVTSITMPDADLTFRPVWKSIGQITVAVTDFESNNFAGCVVTLKQGDDTLATLTTGESGVVSFDNLAYGNYSIVVTYTDGTTATYTTGTVLGESEKTVPVQMSERRFNTEVVDGDNKNVSVENLEDAVPEEDKAQIVTTAQPGDVTEISVVLSVVNETNAAVVTEMTKAIENDKREVVDLSDITLVKIVKVIDENGAEVSTDSTMAKSENLVDITFPITEEIYAALAEVHGTIANLLVARKTADGVEYMTKLSEDKALSSTEECFYVTEKDGVPYVVVRTDTFSTTYGLCVNGGTVRLNNAIESFELADMTYGGTPSVASATATYGVPVITYYVNGEYVSVMPTAAGTYYAKAEVEQTDLYSGATAMKQFTIAKAKYQTNIKFEDMTVVYDGEVHSIVAENLPDGVTVSYENNGQVDVGVYEVKVHFIGNANYESIPSMVAILTITDGEEQGKKPYLFLWILLAIAIIETILFIILFVRGRKYKKELKEAKKSHVKAMSFAALFGTGWMIPVNIALLVYDVIMLGVLIAIGVINRKNKKKLEELKKENKE